MSIPPITQAYVSFLLEPLVGQALLRAKPELSADIADMLSQYDWRYGGSPEILRTQIESKLLHDIYEHTRGDMTVTDGHGRRKKIYTDALAQITEILLEPMLERLPVCRETFEMLNDYAMRRLSLPVLKRLYTGFADMLEPMNRALFARVITENFPFEAYQDWLAE